VAESPDPATAREEAERLVATAIGAATMAARQVGRTRRGPGESLPGALGPLADALYDTARSALGFGHNPSDYKVANGSPECCVCPVCRVIAAMRDPNPETAERLATGAGDLAAGVASFLRSVTGTDSPPASAPAAPAAADQGQVGVVRRSNHDHSPLIGEERDVWRAATHESPAPAPKPMAKKAVKPAAPPAGDGDEAR
jgi:hypothetical protein